MFKFSDILPFSSSEFYLFIAFSIALIFASKYVLRGKIAYQNIIFTISFLYLILLFPKPIHFITFTLYGFFIFKFLGRKKQMGGIFIVLLYVLPLILMKLTHVIPVFKLEKSLISIIFQIAGLSYATFKMIQIHIDERESDEKISFVNYFNFIAFTPTLLIGPIDRFARFQKNINQGFANLNQENFNKGLEFIMKGLLYKYIFAYAIFTLFINHLDASNGFLYHLSYMYSYLIYLFFDFAGYSLLAMGFGYMLGIQVPFNFDKPFLAQNPKEFWHHWHKTLGDWLNDYFFKPIFKDLTTRKVFTSIQRQSLALFLTFTLMGFWNGFEIHYILSGVLFGIYSMGHNYYAYLCKKNGKDVVFGKLNSTAIKYISIFLMFNSVAFAIYIFSGKLF
ncbi:MAG: MBOAT family O-acyltransferase [Bacteroidota bacterium]